jgi:hypothetical protein
MQAIVTDDSHLVLDEKEYTGGDEVTIDKEQAQPLIEAGILVDKKVYKQLQKQAVAAAEAEKEQAENASEKE